MEWDIRFPKNSFKNKIFSDSNEIQSLKENLESAINETLFTLPAPQKGSKPIKYVWK